METVSHYANQAMQLENELRYAEAAEMWQEASRIVLSLRIADQFKDFADRCMDKLAVTAGEV